MSERSAREAPRGPDPAELVRELAALAALVDAYRREVRRAEDRTDALAARVDALAARLAAAEQRAAQREAAGARTEPPGSG